MNSSERATQLMFEPFAGLSQHKDLVWQLTKREVLGRYRGSLLGFAWTFVNPILMLGVYTFVFSVVFRARWVGGQGDHMEFATMIFSGMIVHAVFAECIARGPSLVLANPNYIKKVVFPLEVLPWTILGSAVFHAVIGTAILMMFALAVGKYPSWSALLAPVVLIPLFMTAMGASWLLSSIGVYVRDVAQVVGVINSVLLFFSPVFYPVSALPEKIQWIFYLNPLTITIEQFRGALFEARIPNPVALAVAALIAFVIMWFGFYSFKRLRIGFADVV